MRRLYDSVIHIYFSNAIKNTDKCENLLWISFQWLIIKPFIWQGAVHLKTKIWTTICIQISIFHYSQIHSAIHITFIRFYIKITSIECSWACVVQGGNNLSETINQFVMLCGFTRHLISLYMSYDWFIIIYNRILCVITLAGTNNWIIKP